MYVFNINVYKTLQFFLKSLIDVISLGTAFYFHSSFFKPNIFLLRDKIDIPNRGYAVKKKLTNPALHRPPPPITRKYSDTDLSIFFLILLLLK